MASFHLLRRMIVALVILLSMEYIGVLRRNAAGVIAVHAFVGGLPRRNTILIGRSTSLLHRPTLQRHILPKTTPFLLHHQPRKPQWQHLLNRESTLLLHSSLSSSSSSSSSSLLGPLVDSLDLRLLIRNVVSVYCGTKRGRQALIELVGESTEDINDDDTFGRRPRQSQGVVIGVRSSSSLSSRWSRFHQSKAEKSSSSMSSSSIVPLARSIGQVQLGYELVEQAMIAFINLENEQNEEEATTKTDLPTWPPIYGADSSPLDTMTIPSTDYDEWIWESTSPSPSSSSLEARRFAALFDADDSTHPFGEEQNQYQLEQVLHASQVIRTIQATLEWAQQESTTLYMPLLSRMVCTTAETVATRFVSVGTPTRSSQSKNENRNPSNQGIETSSSSEKDNQRTIMEGLMDLLSSALNDLDGKVNIVEVQGSATTTTKAYRFELNPKAFPELAEAVIQNQSSHAIDKDDNANIQQVEEELIGSLRSTMQRVAPLVDSLWQQVVARLDIMFAKAAFAYEYDGKIPLVKQEGRIQVHNFVHPVLLQKQQQQDDHHTPGVQPIDLFLNVPISTSTSGATTKRKKSSNTSGDVDAKTEATTEAQNVAIPNARALILSGPNGGGKSVALKSFGLVACMIRLGIPIPTVDNDDDDNDDYDNDTERRGPPRVDFFPHVFTELGDDGQSVEKGTSTFMAKLNTYSTILHRIKAIQVATVSSIKSSSDGAESAGYGDEVDQQHQPRSQPQHSLVLLDELGSGTDPVAGGAMGRAIIEDLLLSAPTVQCVVTTHSPQLKAWSYNSPHLECATVLLQSKDIPEYVIGDPDEDKSDNNMSNIRVPTHELKYGLVGDSCALEAARRSQPCLPQSVLDRTAQLLSESAMLQNARSAGRTRADNSKNDENAVPSTASSQYDYYATLVDSMEQQISQLETARETAQARLEEAVELKQGMHLVARAYQQHLAALDQQLGKIRDEIVASDTPLDVVGESIAILRTMKKRQKSDEELLREQGLVRVPFDYTFSKGEMITILCRGQWEGMTATVLDAGDNGSSSRLLVLPSIDPCSTPFFLQSESDNGIDMEDPMMVRPLELERHEVAIWDYQSALVDVTATNDPTKIRTPSLREAHQQLSQVLSSLPKNRSRASINNRQQGKNNKFTSSRQRKAASKQQKSKRKKK